MFQLKSNNLKDFPFQDAYKLSDKDLEGWAKDTVHLSSFNSWMLPQMLAYFGTFKCTKLEDGTYDSKALLADNIGQDPWSIGLWAVVTKMNRSALVKAQNTPAFTRYSALVPLILAGIKNAQNIPYSKWSRDFLVHVMGKRLYEAATTVPPKLTIARILELRKDGLTTKTGKNAGESKEAKSSWTLSGLKHTEWGELPAYGLTMAGQVWVAHPDLRCSDMILDPSDWENIPDALVSTTVVNRLPASAVKYADPVGVTPW